MKFLHLGDLHLGKRLNGFNIDDLVEDALEQVINMAVENQADAVLIAGDVFDHSLPAAESMAILDRFLSRLARLNIQVCMISGNHDSALRLNYGSSAFEQLGIHIASIFQPDVRKVNFGEVDVWMVPFIRPGMVQPFFEEPIADYNEMYDKVISALPFEPGHKNVLLCHQFFAGSSPCQSEEVTIGTADNISTRFLEGFDYVAAGHIHSPQAIGRPQWRYAGTLLKYSRSETSQIKSVPLVSLNEEAEIELLPIQPLRDVKKLQGRLDELLNPEFYRLQNPDDFYFVRLTDEKPQLDTAARLRQVYPNLLSIEENSILVQEQSLLEEALEALNPLEIIGQFYEMQRGRALDSDQAKTAAALWEEALCGQ